MSANGVRLDLNFPGLPVSGSLVGFEENEPTLPLLVCIHGGGCNSGYFDIKGHSTLAMARAQQFPVLLINRPGHGGNPRFLGARPIADAIPDVRDFIHRVVTDRFPSRSVFLLGHSIGAAVALMLAASPGDLTLSGVAVSGVGDETPHLWTNEGLSSSLNVNEFLGPAETWSWEVLPRLRRVSEPWIKEEVIEIRNSWPVRWPSVAAGIEVPVHLRLADHEAIWVTGEAVVKRMASALAGSARVDAAVLHDGGHLYELHKRGLELVASQLEFAAGAVRDGNRLPDADTCPDICEQQAKGGSGRAPRL